MDVERVMEADVMIVPGMYVYTRGRSVWCFPRHPFHGSDWTAMSVTNVSGALCVGAMEVGVDHRDGEVILLLFPDGQLLYSYMHEWCPV